MVRGPGRYDRQGFGARDDRHGQPHRARCLDRAVPCNCDMGSETIVDRIRVGAHHDWSARRKKSRFQRIGPEPGAFGLRHADQVGHAPVVTDRVDLLALVLDELGGCRARPRICVFQAEFPCERLELGRELRSRDICVPAGSLLDLLSQHAWHDHAIRHHVIRRRMAVNDPDMRAESPGKDCGMGKHVPALSVAANRQHDRMQRAFPH